MYCLKTKKELFALLTILALLFPSYLISKTASQVENSKQKSKEFSPTIENHAEFFQQASQQENINADKADEIRVKSINSISSLIESEKIDKNKKFELYLRMGELYVERHDYLRGKEIESFVKEYDKWQNEGAKNKEPVINHQNSKNELTKGTNAFRSLVTKYPKHPRLDAVLMELGRNLTRLNNDNAIMYYNQLLTEYPKSKLIPDVYLALGEHYFDKHDINNALKNYRKAMDFKDHRVYPYAVYKLGWSHFNYNNQNPQEEKENLNKALAAFKLVIKLADKNKDNSALTNLREEAVKDLVLVWAEIEDVDAAWAYFKTIGENDAFFVLLERLGGIYSEQGKSDKALAVYNRLLNQAPNRESSPKIHENIARLYEVTNKPELIVSTLDTMAKLYVNNGAWVKAQKDAPKELFEGVAKQLENSLYRYAATFHNSGIKRDGKRSFVLARDSYLIYLRSFPEHANAYTIRYNLADIYFNLNEYDQAASEYMTVSQNKSESKFLKDAAMNAVVSMNKIIEIKKYPALPPPGEVAEPVAIPSEKLKLIKTLENFVALLPKEKNSSNFTMTASNIYFSYGHYEKAITQYKGIIETYPETKEAENSVQIVINFFAKHKKWPDMVAFIGSVSSKPNLLKEPKLRDFVSKSLQNATFNLALLEESRKNYLAAADKFMEYQKNFSKDENSDRALHNASINYYRAGKAVSAINALEMLINNYPKSTMAPDAFAKLAETHDGLGEVEKAAYYYSQLGTRYPTDKRTPISLYNAATIYFGLTKFSDAKLNYQKVIASHKNSEFFLKSLSGLAATYEKTALYKDASNEYEKLSKVATDKQTKMFARAKQASLMLKFGETKKGDRLMTDLLREVTSDQETEAFEARKIVAEYHFSAIQNKYNEFMNTTLQIAKLEKTVNDKQNILKFLADSYQRIIAIGSPEYLVASLYQLGCLHEDFSNRLFAVEAPKGTAPKEVDQLKSTLEKLAFPLKKDAMEYFETAYQKSIAVHSFSSWTQLTYKKLTQLNSTKYPLIDAIALTPGYQSHKIVLTDATASLAN